MRLARALALTLVLVAVGHSIERSAAAAELDIRGVREGFDAKELDELVDLELGPSSDVTRIVVRLDADRADVEITLRGADRSRRGIVNLRGTRDAPRAVALFVGELSRTAALPPEPAPPAPPAPTASDRREEPPPSSRGALEPFASATMGVRWLTSGGAVVLGPRLEGGLSVGRALHLGVLARYGYVSRDDALGSVRAHLVSGGLGATYDLIATDAFALGTGPRAELGVVAAHGEGVGGSSASDYSLSSSWELGARLRIGGSVFLAMLVELGWLGHGLELHADDRSVLSLSGPFAGASAGLAFVPRRPE